MLRFKRDTISLILIHKNVSGVEFQIENDQHKSGRHDYIKKFKALNSTPAT